MTSYKSADSENITRRLFTFLIMGILVAACAPQRQFESAASVRTPSAIPTGDTVCRFGTAPTVIQREAGAILQVWIIPETAVLYTEQLPPDTAFAAYRHAITEMGANVMYPPTRRPQNIDENMRPIWDREEENVRLAYSGTAGRIRPIHCLDGLLFAFQNARYPQLSMQTEFIASILREQRDPPRSLKIYFAGGEQAFPPKGMYGLDHVERDVANGWEFWAALHNHPLQADTEPTMLGVPAPSTSDVDLLRNLAQRLGLQYAWVTNGFYTIEIPADALDGYRGRP